MNVHVPFGDALVRCSECNGRTVFMEFDEEQKVEIYQCKDGHRTEVPERENGRFGKS